MNSEKREIDWKFIIGMVILVLVLALTGTLFWKKVSEQARSIKQEEESLLEENAVDAIFLVVGEGILQTELLVDLDTLEAFTAKVPAEGIYNKNDVLIPGDVLEDGDKVRIFGDHVFSGEGKIPVYENVVKMQRTGRATLAEAEEYRQKVLSS